MFETLVKTFVYIFADWEKHVPANLYETHNGPR
jgi:hypothetical protein